ncbi:MAG TPA: DUF4236 domain-containing protein [Solirubrobacterales bacterium]|nr:DUF4236 domain-containing protein [Solirubrobacterales bacterium]
MSFKVAPGVRIRASSRGISAGVGPRAARVHVGTRGVGVSSGVGPVSGYAHLGGGGSRKAPARRASYGGPTKASIAAREREAKAAAREADIEAVTALEEALVSVHKETFPPSAPVVLPPPEEVDPAPIRAELEDVAGIPDLLAATGGGETPPVAIDPEPVDRYELMREHRRRARAGIPIWSVRRRIDAARAADEEAEAAASVERDRRGAVQRTEQARLDEQWAELGKARALVAEQLETNVAAERRHRAAQRDAEQAEVDEVWRRLQANDPEVTLAILEKAFADNEAPAAAIDCEGDHTTVVMQFVTPEAIVPERKPARTPTGRRTLKKRTKSEINALYLKALGSNVLATVKEGFAVAPGTEVIQLLVVRRESDKRHHGEMAVVYVGEFDRASFAGASGARDPARSLGLAEGAMLNLKGQSAAVSPIDLSGRPDLGSVLDQVRAGLTGS